MKMCELTKYNNNKLKIARVVFDIFKIIYLGDHLRQPMHERFLLTMIPL